MHLSVSVMHLQPPLISPKSDHFNDNYVQVSSHLENKTIQDECSSGFQTFILIYNLSTDHLDQWSTGY